MGKQFRQPQLHIEKVVMIYLFCSAKLRASGARLHAILRDHLIDEPISMVPSIDGLRQQLSQPYGKAQGAIVVFTTYDNTELRLLQDLNELLANSPLVLLTQEQNKETIALAHALFPRFLCCVDDDYQMIAQVIEKILATNRT